MTIQSAVSRTPSKFHYAFSTRMFDSCYNLTILSQVVQLIQVEHALCLWLAIVLHVSVTEKKRLADGLSNHLSNCASHL